MIGYTLTQSVSAVLTDLVKVKKDVSFKLEIKWLLNGVFLFLAQQNLNY